MPEAPKAGPLDAPTTPPASDVDGGGPSSSLDPPESSSHGVSPPQYPCGFCPCDADQEFRHSGWHRQRQATWEALRSTSQPAARVEAFEQCGQRAWVEESTIGPKDFRIKASHCHDRFCVPCAVRKAYAVAHEIATLAAKASAPVRFVTFTLKGKDDEGLRDRLDRLYSSFRQLRRLAFWEDAVVGGVAVCEIKRNNGRWHVHLHCLVETEWLDQRQVSRAWHGITGDSFIVDVRPVRDLQQGVAYVAKYAGKPMDSGFWQDRSLLQEAMLALKGRRLVASFGTWYNPARDLDGDELIEQDDGTGAGWRPVAPLAELWKRAQLGDTWAARVLALLRIRDPLTGERQTGPPAADPPA